MMRRAQPARRAPGAAAARIDLEQSDATRRRLPTADFDSAFDNTDVHAGPEWARHDLETDVGNALPDRSARTTAAASSVQGVVQRFHPGLIMEVSRRATDCANVCDPLELAATTLIVMRL